MRAGRRRADLRAVSRQLRAAQRSHPPGVARRRRRTPRACERIGEDKEAEYRRLAEAHGLTPLPGAREWLAALRAAGWKQAIASSAPARQRRDDAAGARASTAVSTRSSSAEDVTIGKPDPQVFLKAAEKLADPAGPLHRRRRRRRRGRGRAPRRHAQHRRHEERPPRRRPLRHVARGSARRMRSIGCCCRRESS